MKKVYYLDSENIHYKHLAGLIEKFDLNFGDETELIIIKSNNTNELEYADYELLRDSFDRVIFKRITVSRSDALDFFLVSDLSMYAQKSHNCEFFVISKDKGFTIAIENINAQTSNKVSRLDLDMLYDKTIENEEVYKNKDKEILSRRLEKDIKRYITIPNHLKSKENLLYEDYVEVLTNVLDTQCYKNKRFNVGHLSNLVSRKIKHTNSKYKIPNKQYTAKLKKIVLYHSRQIQESV